MKFEKVILTNAHGLFKKDNCEIVNGEQTHSAKVLSAFDSDGVPIPENVLLPSVCQLVVLTDDAIPVRSSVLTKTFCGKIQTKIPVWVRTERRTTERQS